MLDEYLENEGKLIDERADSFSQPPVEAVTYELPTRSTSYVRTLDHVLKKQGGDAPTSDLISGFVPPSKRPRLSLTSSKLPLTEKPKRGPKLGRVRARLGAAGLQPGLELAGRSHTFKRRRLFRPKTSSQTLSPPHTRRPPPQDLAPLESDSEVDPTRAGLQQGPHGGPGNQGSAPPRVQITQRDLEDTVVWAGKPRTCITEERAAIALTSLFTLTVTTSRPVTKQLVSRDFRLEVSVFLKLRSFYSC